MRQPPTSSNLDLDAYFKEIHKNQFNQKKTCSKTTVFLLLLLVLIGAILFFNFNPIPFQFTNKPIIGTSKGYLKAALKFHDYVNKSVNPCDDFFEHACGKYLANIPIPAHMTSYSDFARLREETSKNMKMLLESPEVSTSSAINKMKSVYRTCMKQEDYVLKAPNVALKAVNVFGSWPMFEGPPYRPPSDFSLQKLLTISRDVTAYGHSTPLFSFFLERYPKDQKTRILTFEQSRNLLLDIEHHLDHQKYEKERKAGKKLIIDRITQFSKDLGVGVNSQLTKDVEDIIAFEEELAKIMEYKKETQGVKEQTPFADSCVYEAEDLSHAFGALYARNYFDEETKASMNVLVANLKESFAEMVKENTWMDKETKARAMKKAMEMEVLVGYSEHAFDDAKLDDYYAKLDILDTDDYITISEKLKLFPAAFLQFPMFEKDQPQAMNYGSAGMIIGHEITHGFDDVGKNYDEEGNLDNWWSNTTLKQYTEKAQCFVEQYGAVEVPGTGMHINGKLTLGENIGDNGGIREAYGAFQKFLSKNSPEPLLPGIDATPEQLFFYNFPMCGVQRPGFLKYLLSNDNHSPYRYRTNLVAQNTPEFAKAFNCPLGSPMNPVKKCAVW